VTLIYEPLTHCHQPESPLTAGEGGFRHVRSDVSRGAAGLPEPAGVHYDQR
jgi:hypothetical protein